MKKIIIVILLFASCATVQHSNAIRQSDDMIRSSATDKEKINFLRNVIDDQGRQIKEKDKEIQHKDKLLIAKDKIIDEKTIEIKKLNSKISSLAVDAGFVIWGWRIAIFAAVAWLVYQAKSFIPNLIAKLF